MDDLCVVIPVFNEERDLPGAVATVAGFLEGLPWTHSLVIADNGSTDGTWALAKELAAGRSDVRAVHLDQKGRGRALRRVWLNEQARVLAYMDVDLSTSLAYVAPLVGGVLSGGFELTTGSRLLRPDLVQRGWKRELLSRGYNRLVKLALGTHFSDAQCGFKAISYRAAHELVPDVQDEGWFFDTELLALAEWRGYRILDLPVEWRDDADSRVNVWPTILADLRGLWRLWRSRSRRVPAVQPEKLSST